MVFPRFILVVSLAVACSVSFGAKRKCEEVVIAPGLGADSRSLASLIARATGRGNFYYPLNIEQLNTLAVDDLFPAFIPAKPYRLSNIEGYAFEFPPTNEPAFCSMMASDKLSFEIADILGRKVYYRYVSGGYRRTRRDLTNLPDVVPYVPRLEKTFNLPKKLKPLAESLTKTQLSLSDTYRNARTPEKRRIRASRNQINLALLEKIERDERITPENIQDWTKLILDASPLESEEEQRSYWVIRGTRFSYNESSTVKVTVDLRGAQYTGSGIFADKSFEGFRNTEVPDALDELLGRLHRLNHESTVSEALLVGRDYLRLHPTIEGNGRLGRLLFDYCLIKAGFPPLPSIDAKYLTPYFRNDIEFVRQVLEQK